MNKRKLFSILIALTLILITIPPTYALDEWVISEVDEDVFWSTYQFDDVDLNYLQGDEIQIRGWYLFEGPDVLEWGKPISEAYLSLKSMGDATPDPDASMTLYIQPARKGGALSIYDDVSQINGPYDSNYVNVNLSSFVGGGVWHNITVTNMVRAVNQGYYFYNGHDVAFITLSTDNHDAERYISSEESGFAAKLYVHYETPDTPPGLPPDAEWEEDYRNYSIWSVPGAAGSYPIDPMEYVFGTNDENKPMYYGSIPSMTKIEVVEAEVAGSTLWNTGRNIVRISNGTIVVTYLKYLPPNQIMVKQSNDNGTTWTNEVNICTYPGMSTNHHTDPMIAVDSLNQLHVVWTGQATGYEAEDQLWYAKYNGTWNTPIRLSTAAGLETREQEAGYISIDSNDYLHVAWGGDTPGLGDQVWYRNYTDSWSTPLRISIYDTMGSANNPSLAVDFSDYLHIVWSAYTDTYPSPDTQVWYMNYTDSWSTPFRLSTLATMDTNANGVASIALDSDDYKHVIFLGLITGLPKQQVYYTNYTDSWSTPLRISTATDMNLWHIKTNTIALDSNDDIHVLAHGPPVFDGVWYMNYTGSWSTPIRVHDSQSTSGSLRWARYPSLSGGNDTFIAVDENGTIVQTWNGENCTSIDCIKDDIDDEIGYGDPEDPAPPGWEDPVFWSIHRFKLVLFLIGMILFVGSPIYGFAQRPEAATWIMLMMNMLIGVALLWSLQTM